MELSEEHSKASKNQILQHVEKSPNQIACTQYMQLATGEKPLFLQSIIIDYLCQTRNVCLGEELPWDQLIARAQRMKYAEGETEPQYFKHVKSFSGVIHLDSDFSRDYEYFNNTQRMTGNQLLDKFPESREYLEPIIRSKNLHDKIIIVPTPVPRIPLPKFNQYERPFPPEKEWMIFKKIHSDKGKSSAAQTEEFQSSYFDMLLADTRPAIQIPPTAVSEYIMNCRFDEDATVLRGWSSNQGSSDDDAMSIPNFEGRVTSKSRKK